MHRRETFKIMFDFHADRTMAANILIAAGMSKLFFDPATSLELEFADSKTMTLAIKILNDAAVTGKFRYQPQD